MRRRRSTLALMIAASLLVASCSGETATTVEVEPPAVLEPTEQEGLSRISLSSSAAQRLGITTDAVADAADAGEAMRTMPYGALIYDPNGGTWAYTNPDGLDYIRAALTVERIEGDLVFLSDGPRAGTDVVSIGAAELYGIEFGIGK